MGVVGKRERRGSMTVIQARRERCRWWREVALRATSMERHGDFSALSTWATSLGREGGGSGGIERRAAGQRAAATVMGAGDLGLSVEGRRIRAVVA